MKKFNLKFLNESILLSSKEYKTCKEIQNEYANYTTSINFDSLDAIKEYIILDYKLERIKTEN